MSVIGYGGVAASVDPIKKTLNTSTTLTANAQMDLFNRLKVAIGASQFTYQNEYSKGENQWVEKITGTASATHDPTDSTVNLSVTGVGSIIRQTRKYFRYWSGKTLSTILTYSTGVLAPNYVFRVGYFENDNGVYMEHHDSGPLVGIRNEGVDIVVPRSQWNEDKLDGTGKSTATYNFTKSTIFAIDLQWLGVGIVRMAVELPNGELLYFHTFEHSGLIDSTYMRTANLPIRYELIGLEGATGTQTVKQICSSVWHEDGGCGAISAYAHSVSSPNTPVSVTTRRSILALRPKTTYNSLPNRSYFTLRDVAVLVGGNNVYWEIVFNPTYSGTPTWTSVGNHSTVEFSTDANVISGGIVVASGYGVSGTGSTRQTLSRDINNNYPFGLDIDGANPTSFALVMTSLSGTATVNGAMHWEEIY